MVKGARKKKNYGIFKHTCQIFHSIYGTKCVWTPTDFHSPSFFDWDSGSPAKVKEDNMRWVFGEACNLMSHEWRRVVWKNKTFNSYQFQGDYSYSQEHWASPGWPDGLMAPPPSFTTSPLCPQSGHLVQDPIHFTPTSELPHFPLIAWPSILDSTPKYTEVAVP